MKKIYFVGQLVLFVFIGMLAGCKKESIASNEETLVSEKGIANLKSWFESQKTSRNLVNKTVLEAGTIDWAKTQYSTLEKTYFTPINLPTQKKCVAFFVAKENERGQINSGKYVYIVDENENENLSKINTFDLDIINGDKIEPNFNLVFIENDLENKQIKSTIIENGKINKDKKCNILISPTLIDDINSVKNMPDPGFPMPTNCTAWYLAYFDENGNLQSYTYLFTSCVEGGGGSGGGGGTTIDPNTLCNNLTNALNSISHTITNDLSMNAGPIITNQISGKITRGIAPKGSIHAFPILGYRPSYRAFYLGSIYKNNSNDPL